MAGPRSNRRYVAMREALKRKRLPCWLCGQPIDYTAPKGDPHSFTADHVKPIATHPDLALDPTNLKPAHYRCNTRRQDGPPRPDTGTTSRPW